MENKVIKKKAYSLTEVLITMFVLMLIVLLSAPAFTRKKTIKQRPHGVWECKLVNGRHVSTTNVSGATPVTADEGDYCTFNPQPSADSYSITVVADGGGGASGASAVQDAVSYGETSGYKVENPGNYDILVVGGGGGGSAKLKNYGGYGGSAGQINISRNRSLSKGYYVLKAGAGGRAGGTPPVADNDGSDGDIDVGEICHVSSGNSWRNICNGGDGETSSIYKVGGGLEMTASGGKGGGQNSSTASNSDNTYCTSRRGGYISGGKIFKSGNGGSSSNCYIAREIIGYPSSYTSTFGHGGNGTTTMYAEPGYNGVVILVSSSFYAGGGGKRGGVAYMTLKKINDPVKVYVGRGGAGATVENISGEPGENSAFGNYLTAKGGNGGQVKAKNSSSTTSGISGENGAQSPYGGILAGGSSACDSSAMNGKNDMDTDNGYVDATDSNYGAGGGGGGAWSHRANSTSCSISQKWGKGGRGAPGYVRIEWN